MVVSYSDGTASDTQTDEKGVAKVLRSNRSVTGVSVAAGGFAGAHFPGEPLEQVVIRLKIIDGGGSIVCRGKCWFSELS